MEHCCEAKSEQLDVLWSKQSRTLWVVLTINAVMFFVEAAVGLLAGSAALLADALDMLGDALVYGVSLFVVGRSLRARSRAAAMKGSVMLLFGLGVLAEVAYKILTRGLPDAPLMSGTAALAMLANGVCMVLLTRHRADDLNMQSAWVCSRNDIAANFGVLVAAAGVYLTQTVWPDIVVGLLITVLFLWSSIRILRQAVGELRRSSGPVPASSPSGRTSLRLQ